MIDAHPVAPRADLHLHLDGAVRIATLRELARKNGHSVERLDWLSRTPEPSSLTDFLQRFGLVLPELQTISALSRAAFEATEDAAAVGVNYCELRFCPLLHLRCGLKASDAVAAVLEGIERAGAELGLSGRLILCMMHGMDQDDARGISRLAVRFRERGVVGVDLAGDEAAGFDLRPFEWGFLNAEAEGLGTTVHAGESGKGRNVKEAILRLHAKRIGHGTAVISDPSSLELVLERRVGVECCLSSNLQTGAIKRISDHPLRILLDRGVAVVVCTDNPVLSATNLRQELELAAEAFSLGTDELERLRDNGFHQAFDVAAARSSLAGRGKPIAKPKLV